MARGFGPTSGQTDVDTVVTGSLNLGANPYTVSLWTLANTSGGGTHSLYYYSGPNDFIYIYGGIFYFNRIFSTTNGTWSYFGGASPWRHLCITYDPTSISNIPTIYLNGIAQTLHGSTTPVGTSGSSAGAYTLGNTTPTNINRYWDGNLAEFAIWNNTLLTASEVNTLYKGVSPLAIRNSNLSLYLPLYGVSGEPDWGNNHVTNTVSGTLYQPHPGLNSFPCGILR